MSAYAAPAPSAYAAPASGVISAPGLSAAIGGEGRQTTIRTLCVNITGSLANLAMAGPQAALWKPVSGKEQMIFSNRLASEATDGVASMNELKGMKVLRATLAEHYSSFPCTMGVSISGIPASEVTDLGEKFAYTVTPYSRLSTPHHFFMASESETDSTSWRKLYSKWNATNLESEGVLDVSNQPFVFVNMSHPIVGLLRHNAEMIGCNIDAQPVIDGEWYKLTRQVLSTCCATLRTKVLSKVLTQDLSNFSVQLTRLDAHAWDDLGNGSVPLQGFVSSPTWTDAELDMNKEHHLRQFVTTPYQYVARIQLEYETPPPAA